MEKLLLGESRASKDTRDHQRCWKTRNWKTAIAILLVLYVDLFTHRSIFLLSTTDCEKCRWGGIGVDVYFVAIVT